MRLALLLILLTTRSAHAGDNLANWLIGPVRHAIQTVPVQRVSLRYSLMCRIAARESPD